MTYTTVAANAICPNASAVPRLLAPSAPARALARMNAPNIIVRLRPILNPPVPGGRHRTSRSPRRPRSPACPLKDAQQRRHLQIWLLRIQERFGRVAASEGAQSPLAVLHREVSQRTGPACPPAPCGDGRSEEH